MAATKIDCRLSTVTLLTNNRNNHHKSIKKISLIRLTYTHTYSWIKMGDSFWCFQDKEEKQTENRKAAHDTRIRLISFAPCHTLHIQITSHYIISFRLLTLTHTLAQLWADTFVGWTWHICWHNTRSWEPQEMLEEGEGLRKKSSTRRSSAWTLTW